MASGLGAPHAPAPQWEGTEKHPKVLIGQDGCKPPLLSWSWVQGGPAGDTRDPGVQAPSLPPAPSPPGTGGTQASCPPPSPPPHTEEAEPSCRPDAAAPPASLGERAAPARGPAGRFLPAPRDPGAPRNPAPRHPGVGKRQRGHTVCQGLGGTPESRLPLPSPTTGRRSWARAGDGTQASGTWGGGGHTRSKAPAGGCSCRARCVWQRHARRDRPTATLRGPAQPAGGWVPAQGFPADEDPTCPKFLRLCGSKVGEGGSREPPATGYLRPRGARSCPCATGHGAQPAGHHHPAWYPQGILPSGPRGSRPPTSTGAWGPHHPDSPICCAAAATTPCRSAALATHHRPAQGDGAQLTRGDGGATPCLAGWCSCTTQPYINPRDPCKTPSTMWTQAGRGCLQWAPASPPLPLGTAWCLSFPSCVMAVSPGPAAAAGRLPVPQKAALAPVPARRRPAGQSSVGAGPAASTSGPTPLGTAQPQLSLGKLRHGTAAPDTTEPCRGLAPPGCGDTAPRCDVGIGAPCQGVLPAPAAHAPAGSRSP